MCQPDLSTDEFAAPTSSLSESHYPHTLQANYDDPQSDYGVSQSSQYGLPSPKLRLITKNVYVHIPPDEPEFQSVQSFEKPIPQKHYNIIFIKGFYFEIIQQLIQNNYNISFYIQLQLRQHQHIRLFLNQLKIRPWCMYS